MNFVELEKKPKNKFQVRNNKEKIIGYIEFCVKNQAWLYQSLFEEKHTATELKEIAEKIEEISK